MYLIFNSSSHYISWEEFRHEKMDRIGYDPAHVKQGAEQMIESDPSSAPAYQLPGYGEWKLGHRARAYEALRKAMH